MRYATGLLALALLAGGLMPPPGRAQQKGGGGAPPDEDHVPDPPGRIAFASDRAGNFEIYIMNPDGGGLVRVTNDPAEDTHPTWSPDGTRLAFVSNRDGNKEIYVVNDDGSGLARVTDNSAEDLSPVWSASVTNPRIAFVSHRDGNDEVYTVDPDGQNLFNVTKNTADDNDPAWLLTNAGSQLAFASNRDGDKFEVYRSGADGLNPQRVTDNSANDVHPAWPAGRIFFQSDRDGNDEIYVMNADGTGQSRLTNNAAFDLAPATSSDGARLVWVSNRDAADNLDIYASAASGAGVVRLTSDPASDVDPAVEPFQTAASLGSFQLSAAAYAVNEGQGRIEITVTRVGGTGAAAVDISTVSGSASERMDYTPVYRTLVFGPGVTTRTVTIPIIDDAIVEGNETFTVTLGNPTNSTLAGPFNADVTITDNDGGGPAGAARLLAVTAAGALIRFSAATPGTIDSTVAITGLQSGETILGADVRPITGQLYALGSTGRLYTIDPATGAATLASTVSVALSGTSFGVDFNPVVDRLRVTSDADQNLRVNVDTGAATVDGTLAYAAGDANAGQNPNVVGTAYLNNVPSATATTLYDIDSGRDALVIQNPPNNGTLATVGPLGVDSSDVVGFDITPGPAGAAYAVLTVGGASQLYTINLATGAATLVGNVGGGSQVRGLTAAVRNPIDEVEFFVRQQYLDFLNREPDAAGFSFWTGELRRLVVACNTQSGDARSRCVLSARAQISAAFFFSIEFQQTGFFLIRVYQEAFGRLPTLREFLFDVQNLTEGVVIGQAGANERLASNRQEFLSNFVNRPEFLARYSGVSNAAFVDALFTNAGVDPAAEAATRAALVAGMANGTETRLSALVRVADTRSVFNAVYNRAFVLLQYFGYLRRNPSDPPDNNLSGFNFWLNKLNQFTVPGEDARDEAVALARVRRAEMIEAFLDSIEYRSRFGQP